MKFHGHAIECRINAENPVSFRPSPGRIVHYHPPGGLGVRIDSAVYHGYAIPPFYDSLVGKLIVHGKTRSECLMRLRRALDEFVIEGIETTLPLFRALVQEKEIIDGDLPHPLARGIPRPRRARSIENVPGRCSRKGMPFNKQPSSRNVCDVRFHRVGDQPPHQRRHVGLRHEDRVGDPRLGVEHDPRGGVDDRQAG